jgi:hypothetical protein
MTQELCLFDAAASKTGNAMVFAVCPQAIQSSMLLGVRQKSARRALRMCVDSLFRATLVRRTTFGGEANSKFRPAQNAGIRNSILYPRFFRFGKTHQPGPQFPGGARLKCANENPSRARTHRRDSCVECAATLLCKSKTCIQVAKTGKTKKANAARFSL